MEVRAKCRFDLESVKALTRLLMFKKANPKKRMIFWGIVYAIFFIIIVLEMVLWGIDSIKLILLAMCVGVVCLECFWYFLLPRIRYNALAKNQVFPIDKSTIEGGTTEDIRNKLVNILGKKYIICNY